jgi:quercetin dioxygenase-like cupin family protein
MLTRIACVALLSILGLSLASAEQSAEVEIKGFHPIVKAVLTELGHLAELNGKYQLRATEITIDPDGGMGAHHHLGPGIRCISAGELTYTILGKTTIYRRGDCFTETGDVTHDAHNATKDAVILLNFEILPASLPTSKGSIIPAPH